MNIASVMPASVARPRLEGTVIGAVTVDADRVPDEPTPIAIELLASGRTFGARTGYASATQARDAAVRLTAGFDAPAAAIIERDGRFYAQGVSELTWTSAGRGEDHATVAPLAFEGAFANDPAAPGGIVIDNPAVLALVDGATVITRT